MINFKLDETDPIDFMFGKKITQFNWRMSYPDNLFYIEALDTDGNVLHRVDTKLPDELINAWHTDDQINEYIAKSFPFFK